MKAFYETEMPKYGWSKDEETTEAIGDDNTFAFVKSGGEVVVITFLPEAAGNSTRVGYTRQLFE